MKKWDDKFKMLILIFVCISISNFVVAQTFSITIINQKLDFGSFVITNSSPQSITLDTTSQLSRQKSSGIMFLSSQPTFSFLQFRISRNNDGANTAKTLSIVYNGSFPVGSGLSVSFSPAPTNIKLARNQQSRIITVGGILSITPPVSPTSYSTPITISASLL